MSKHKTYTNEERVIPTDSQLEIEPEVAPAPVPPKTGIVVDCARLNVRKKPNADAEVVCVIGRSTEVMVDEENSTRTFYKVCTEAGVEGYCMKQFIEILK